MALFFIAAAFVMNNLNFGIVEDFPIFLFGSQTPVHVLAVHKKVLINQTNIVDSGAFAKGNVKDFTRDFFQSLLAC